MRARGGRGRRNNNYNWYYQQGRNVQQQLQQFQKEKDDIIKKAVEQMKAQNGQVKQTEREEKMRRQDASTISLQEMEEKLEKLCMQMEYQDQAEVNDEEIDEYVFTDAWNPAPLCEYAWQMLDANMSTITATYADPNAYSAWVHALMEDFLASQEQIIGIRGHTRETVNRARARLQNVEIPEHIGLLMLMLRPMRIEGTNLQFVLLPHQLEENHLGNNPGQVINDRIDVVGNFCAARFSDAEVFLRPIGGPVVQLQAPPCVRVNVITHVTNQYCLTPQNGVIDQVANIMFGTNHLSRQYPPMYRMHLIANNRTVLIQSNEVWYDYLYNVSFDHIFEKTFNRSYVMLGNQKEHTGRIVKEIPMRVVDDVNHVMVWNSGVGVKEMMVPWIECDSIQNAHQFVQQLRALHVDLNYSVINMVNQRKMKNMQLIEWFLKIKSVAFGDVTKLFSTLGR